MSSMSISLKMLVETDSNGQAPCPHMGKLLRNSTVSSAVSTIAGSSSASRTSSECSSDAEAEDFPALPSAPRPASSKLKPMKSSSAWFNAARTAAKVMKPAAAATVTNTSSTTQQQEEEVRCTPAAHAAVAYYEPVEDVSEPHLPQEPVEEVPEPLLPKAGLAELNFQYPGDMVVRNTFLDFEGDFATFVPHRRRRARSAEPIRSRELADGEAREFLRPFRGLPAAVQAVEPSPEGPAAMCTNGPAVLQLVTALPLPVIGSEECPTAGSALHVTGQCKPCAFFWKARGCGNGVECPFCHLCDANEKKRRQKEKKASFQFTDSFRSALIWTCSTGFA